MIFAALAIPVPAAINATPSNTPDPAAPTDAEVTRWYQNHPDSYVTPEFRRIKAIVDLLKRQHLSAKLRCEKFRARSRTVAQQQMRRALRHQMSRSQLTHLASPDEANRLASEAAKDLPR